MTALSPETRALLDGLAQTAAAPLAAARTAPPGLYRSPEIHRLEIERIFKRDWVSPGLAAELAAPGQYLTFSIGDQTIFTVRGRDGSLRSFANVCRHRMMRLLEGAGQVARITCPYHAWSYDLDGRLVGAPHMEKSEGFDKKAICLPEYRTEIWQGWIYVTLNPQAPPVAQLLAALEPVVAPYRMAGYRPVVRQDHCWKTNWKLLCENFMEGYHLPVAHRATVGAWFPVEDTTFPAASAEAFAYQTFTKDENAKYGRAHPDNKVLTGAQRYSSVMPTIFPTHMYVLAPDHLWYLSLRPQGPGEVQVRFGVALAPEVDDALGAAREAWLGELVDFFGRVNEEDRGVVEGIYQGALTPSAERGRYSWLERELHDFAKYLQARLGD